MVVVVFTFHTRAPLNDSEINFIVLETAAVGKFSLIDWKKRLRTKYNEILDFLHRKTIKNKNKYLLDILRCCSAFCSAQVARKRKRILLS